jgi:YegS/Rv2252/BmrU family lipid kinase
VGTATELFDRARAADRLTYDRVTSTRSRLLDRTFVTLSRAADYSVLWLGAGGLLALLGGRRGRRAAARGLLSLGVASILANGPLKLLAQRARPALARTPLRHVRSPRTFSFPSAHTGSAFAFATAAGAEAPVLLVPLVALAAGVGYSRVHTRVHYPSDVLAGAALGVAVGLATGRLADAATRRRSDERQAGGEARRAPVTSHVVLVASPHAGRSHQLESARAALAANGLSIARELPIRRLSDLGPLLRDSSGVGWLVIAAGGDGTVGAVSNHVVNTRAVLGILPLGTSNDFARSLGIPMKVEKAVRLFTEGKVATVDVGRLVVAGEEPKHFVHAATAGLNVSFAKLATRASVRRRLGRLTYAVAGALALRDLRSFGCRLTYEGRTEHYELTHLSVINAPVFGGFLGMRVSGSDPDDGLLDVLAVEALPAHRLILVAIHQLFHIGRPIKGIHAIHVGELKAHTDEPLEVALDGEILGRLPADFVVAGEALRVVTPVDFPDDDGG